MVFSGRDPVEHLIKHRPKIEIRVPIRELVELANHDIGERACAEQKKMMFMSVLDYVGLDLLDHAVVCDPRIVAYPVLLDNLKWKPGGMRLMVDYYNCLVPVDFGDQRFQCFFVVCVCENRCPREIRLGLARESFHPSMRFNKRPETAGRDDSHEILFVSICETLKEPISVVAIMFVARVVFEFPDSICGEIYRVAAQDVVFSIAEPYE